MRALERETLQHVQTLDEQVAAFAVEHLFQPLAERWGADAEIVEFVEGIRADLAPRARPLSQQRADTVIPGGPSSRRSRRPALLHRYEVNVFVTHTPSGGAPVIVERHPTYYNLIGRIEYAARYGTMATDHTLVKAGSLLRANGGYLVMRLRDLLANAPGVRRPQARTRAARRRHREPERGDSVCLVPTTGAAA